MKEHVEQIMTQLKGKTFHSIEQANDFFRESLESVAEKQKEEIINLINTLIAPGCIHDGCEYIREGYYQAVNEIIDKIKEI